jgi:hypothetical protein
MPGPWKRLGPSDVFDPPADLPRSRPRGLVWAGLAWIVVVAGILVLAFVAWTTPLRAHSWYEAACCSQRDCAPVEDGVVAEKSDGVHVQGHGILSRTDSRLRMSRDDRDHICQETGKLLCVYRKPNGM